MKVVITTAQDGYIIHSYDEQDPADKTINVVEQREKGDAETLHDVLHVVLNHLGGTGSRYDDKRVYVIIAPGDKHKDFTEAHSNIIWGK